MAPELKENKEFSHWLEEWVAKLNTREFHEHESSRGRTNREEEPRRTDGKQEAALKPLGR